MQADREQAVLDAVPKQLLIGGSWRDGGGGTVLAVEDPASGKVLCEVADATPQDGAAALGAAVDAQAGWARHAPRDRGETRGAAFETIMDRLDDLALLMTLEMGKPLAESRAEIS